MNDCAQTAVYRLSDQKEGNVKIGTTKYRYFTFFFFLLLCVLSVMMYYSELHGVLPFPSLTSPFCRVTVIITYAKQAYLRTDYSLFTERYCLYYLLMLSYIISETTLHI